MSLSVRLDDRTERAIRRLAKRTGRTKSDLIREAIATLEAQEMPAAAPTAYDRLVHLIGGTGSGGRGLSEATGEKFRRLLVLKYRARDTR
jgi:predicted DNA-binding protein